MIRVVLVDDQALIRAGFRALLEAEADIRVVAEAVDGRSGAAAIAEHRPDVALVDIQMPIMDGIEVPRRVAADPELAGVHIVILTNYGLDEYVVDALRAGAAGFMVKDTEPDDLLYGIRVAARGDALLSPAITRRLIADYISRRPVTRVAPASAGSVLTHREREVTALAAYGLSNEEIATRMVISPHTAKTHISHAMTKIGARDRAQLVVYAYQTGLVSAPEG